LQNASIIYSSNCTKFSTTAYLADFSGIFEISVNCELAIYFPFSQPIHGTPLQTFPEAREFSAMAQFLTLSLSC
jgi:hypothetical protein